MRNKYTKTFKHYLVVGIIQILGLALTIFNNIWHLLNDDYTSNFKTVSASCYITLFYYQCQKKYTSLIRAYLRRIQEKFNARWEEKLGGSQ